MLPFSRRSTHFRTKLVSLFGSFSMLIFRFSPRFVLDPPKENKKPPKTRSSSFLTRNEMDANRINPSQLKSVDNLDDLFKSLIDIIPDDKSDTTTPPTRRSTERSSDDTYKGIIDLNSFRSLCYSDSTLKTHSHRIPTDILLNNISGAKQLHRIPTDKLLQEGNESSGNNQLHRIPADDAVKKLKLHTQTYRVPTDPLGSFSLSKKIVSRESHKEDCGMSKSGCSFCSLRKRIESFNPLKFDLYLKAGQSKKSETKTDTSK